MNQINLKPLKDFAKTKLQANSILKKIILLESDFIEIQEFITKCKVWLDLLELERTREGE